MDPMRDSMLSSSDGRIQGDVFCVRCGYNLRTLPTTGNYPECNTPVIESTMWDWLPFANPA